MSFSGMAIHSESSFNESSANRLLAEVLEQKHTIKTFFKENDRTPNYDGTFELVGQGGVPTKQFIVQIKKVENLTQNIQGRHKGCYMYSLETKFLYYVKEKVTESPAIYFVVDIVNKNIFWLYLTDDLLMRMDFEGKDELNYPLTEADRIVDFDAFLEKLNRIAISRNSLFLHKSPEQIAEMQESLDFINHIMDNDFRCIKEAVFPNLWRFGIMHSHSNACSISTGGTTYTAEDTAMFALYPQIKGVADTGLHEFSALGNQIFNHWDMTGKTTPMDYTRNILQEIVKAFFEKGIPVKFLPEIVLQEKLSCFVQKISPFCDFETGTGGITINDLHRGTCLLLQFIHHILFDANLEENELLLKSKYENSSLSRYGILEIDIFAFPSVAIPGFKKFCAAFDDNQPVELDDVMLSLIESDQKTAIEIIVELQKRHVPNYEAIWDYDFFALAAGNLNTFIWKINEVCNKWFSELPAIYNQAYDAMFESKKYRFLGQYEYDNKYIGNGNRGPWFLSVVRKYLSSSFQIIHVPNCNNTFDQDSINKGLQSVSSGLHIERILQRKTPFYDSVRCLLYQGICQSLDLKCNGLSIGGTSLELF